MAKNFLPPSAGKNTGIVLVLCHPWKCVPTAICGAVDISEVICFDRCVICYDR